MNQETRNDNFWMGRAMKFPKLDCMGVFIRNLVATALWWYFLLDKSLWWYYINHLKISEESSVSSSQCLFHSHDIGSLEQAVLTSFALFLFLQKSFIYFLNIHNLICHGYHVNFNRQQWFSSTGSYIHYNWKFGIETIFTSCEHTRSIFTRYQGPAEGVGTCVGVVV
jgi:hypothetical protein